MRMRCSAAGNVCRALKVCKGSATADSRRSDGSRLAVYQRGSSGVSSSLEADADLPRYEMGESDGGDGVDEACERGDDGARGRNSVLKKGARLAGEDGVERDSIK